jgi:hypothetical protein
MTVEAAMRLGIAFAVFAGAVLTASAVLAACPAPPTPSVHAKPRPKPHQSADKCFDLNELPQISQHIIAAERGLTPAKTAPDAAPPTVADPSPARNSLDLGGLAVGLTKPDPAVRPTPTVGYHWSLE